MSKCINCKVSGMQYLYLPLQVRFVVMGNVFPTETKMDRRFDLKGSSHGRTAGSKKDTPDAILKVPFSNHLGLSQDPDC